VAVNFTTLAYLVCQDVFSVPCTFYRPGQAPRQARGIYDTDEGKVTAEGEMLYSDQRTILDVREAEFGGDPPRQHDIVVIPFDCNNKPLGQFEVVDVDDNGGGELTLSLKRWEQILPSLTMIEGPA
jgi:hypothetical protein